MTRIRTILRFGNGIAAGRPREIEAPKAHGLDCNQFAKVDVGSGIFVPRVSDSRYFDEVPEYTPVIRPVYGETVEETEVSESPARNGAGYNDPTELFSNARKRPVYEAIDFNEIVVKKSVPVETAYDDVPVEEAVTGLVEKEIPVAEDAPVEETAVPAMEEVEYIPPAQDVSVEPVAESEIQVLEPFAADAVADIETHMLEPFASDAIPMNESSEEDGVETYDIFAELAIAEYSALAFYEEIRRIQKAEAADISGLAAMADVEIPVSVQDMSEAQDFVDTDELMAELAVAEYSAIALYEVVERVREAEAPAEPLMLEATNTHILALPQGEPVAMLDAPSVSVADTVVVQTEAAKPVRMSLPRFHSIEDLEREAAELEDANYGPEHYYAPQMAETSEVAEISGTVAFAEYTEPNLNKEVIEVVDLSRDVLYAYRPALANDEDLFLSSSRDDDADFPEDGLESYDRKFKLRVSDLDSYAYHFSGNLRQLW